MTARAGELLEVASLNKCKMSCVINRADIGLSWEEELRGKKKKKFKPHPVSGID